MQHSHVAKQRLSLLIREITIVGARCDALAQSMRVLGDLLTQNGNATLKPTKGEDGES